MKGEAVYIVLTLIVLAINLAAVGYAVAIAGVPLLIATSLVLNAVFLLLITGYNLWFLS